MTLLLALYLLVGLLFGEAATRHARRRRMEVSSLAVVIVYLLWPVPVIGYLIERIKR